MRSNWWADVVETVFIALTEGIWVAVLYLLFEVVGRTPIVLGPPLFVLVAGAAALISPRLNRFGSARWQVVSLASVGIGLLGCLLGPGALGTLLRGDPGGAFSAHPGGWLLGLAAFRGMVGAGSLDDPDGASRPFVRGVIALTAIWLYSGFLPDAMNAAFREAAIGPTLVFATLGTAAIGLRRVHAIGAPAGIEWWRNGAWLASLAALIIVLAILAIAVGEELVVAIPALVGLSGFAELAIFAVVILALAASRRADRRPQRSNLAGYIALAMILVIGAVIYHFLHPGADLPPAASGAGSALGATTSNGALGVVLVAVAFVVIALVAIVVAQTRRRPLPAPEVGPAADDSDFEVEAPGWSWLRRAADRLVGQRSDSRPANAEAAYLATLMLLEPLPGERRLSHETPHAHARRLRRDGAGSLELELLAADYQLSRWGARVLSRPETRRAIGRWERSRSWIAAKIQAQEVAREHAQEHDTAGPA